MADADEKARQEKIAAARKRVEQMKKKKGKKNAKKDDAKDNDEISEIPSPNVEGQAETSEPPVTDRAEDNDKTVEDEKTDDQSPSATPSMAQQSKMRSTSFRAGTSGSTSPGPISPDGDTAPDIYRKQVARIEELEKENKKLFKDFSDSEKRWKKAEDELAELREADGDSSAKGGANHETEQLKSEIASLQRQNTQLQQQVSRGSTHAHRSSISIATPSSELQAELDAKKSTIESMEIEISTLKARVQRQESGAETEKEQVNALEEKLARAEAAAGKAQRELQDVKRNLERTTDKAVREGSERSSAEVKVKTLENDLQETTKAKSDLEIKIDALEKKVATLTTIHKEQDSRSQALRKDKERVEKEAKDLRTKVERLETENLKLRSRRSAEGGGGLDDEGVDELENEERLRLERKIRSLEHQVHELRSGQWIEKRREMEATNTGFHDVDLSGGSMGHSSHRMHSSSGLGDFLTNGLNALAGGGGGGAEHDLMDDDDFDFDEDAFRKAREEESKQRLERIKEIKRTLKHWEGWRLDIVDMRRGGGEGIGDIFDV
ncbi:M protein repeat protein [Metarhizium album ARSEF 1941]|uniref:M protein repeat protein n=1 Tax=Metarhizium album (strain ARSEF 1941) TaxID=1081103 RepID=A0A0B2WKD6_METAS|nr:M protein repeat protein [Metarhizium album ARSEF 1941]KHN96521.1 M protein repeat protein [Metarhizium album ARSEF 1941]